VLLQVRLRRVVHISRLLLVEDNFDVQLLRSGVQLGFLLSLDPETERFDNLIFLSHIQILVLEQQLHLFFGQVLDVCIVYQKREVSRNVAQYLGVYILELQVDSNVELVVSDLLKRKVSELLQFGGCFRGADHRVDYGRTH